MRIVSIMNQKGGCGKTTSAINLAGIFARRGYRTLLVDLDPQSHCAAGLAIPEQRIDQDVGDAMLTDPAAFNPQRLIWRVSRNLDLAPSRMKLAGLEAAHGGLADKPDKERRLLSLLSRLSQQYDLCLIDCSPSIGLLTYNALAAATDILIPVETSFFALQGASKQINTIKTMGRRLGASPRYWLVGTIHDESSVLSKDLLAELRRKFESRVAPVVIRRDMTLKEASSFGQPIVEYNPDAAGAQDYQALADWMTTAIGLAPGTVPQFIPDITPEPAELAEPAMAQPATAPVVATPMPVVETAASLLSSRIAEMTAMARGMMGGASTALAEPSGAATATMDAPASTLSVADAPITRTETSPAARALLGARSTKAGVLFVQPLSLGRRVAIAGEFNNWSATATPMRPNEELGVWEVCVPLNPGNHLYRLVVDGRWIVDPHNEQTVPNSFGESNSVIVVPSR